MNRAAKPKAPPTAPEVAAASLCQRVEAPLPGLLSMLPSAACADLDSAACTAPWIRPETALGSAFTANSSGVPTRLAMRAVRVGASSRVTARCRSDQSRAAWAMSRGSRMGAFMAPILAPGS
ncbi:hypothetical protein G6F24_017439 [Rhizopus arrhizus]|nr:hypothetical protein G6F24_017439 [Rhizopus arrhizus]